MVVGKYARGGNRRDGRVVYVCHEYVEVAWMRDGREHGPSLYIWRDGRIDYWNHYNGRLHGKQTGVTKNGK